MNNVVHINIEVTNKCNQKCFYCFNDSQSKSLLAPVAISDWVLVLKHLRLQGLRSLLVTGGEPFMWPDTINLLARAQAMGINTSVLSNGYLVPDLAKDYADIFRKLVVAQISLDAMNPAMHDDRRGLRGAWSQATRAIEALLALRVPVEISCTVSDENIGELDQIGNYAKSLNASLLIRPLSMVGRASGLKVSPFFHKHLESTLNRLKGSGVDVVNDRFMYAQVGVDVDSRAQMDGIFTIESSGNVRCGSLSLNDGSMITNILDLAKSA